jgi:hypothetical protein
MTEPAEAAGDATVLMAVAIAASAGKPALLKATKFDIISSKFKKSSFHLLGKEHNR